MIKTREITQETAEELGLFPKHIPIYPYDHAGKVFNSIYFDDNFIGLVELDENNKPLRLLKL